LVWFYKIRKGESVTTILTSVYDLHIHWLKWEHAWLCHEWV